MPADRLMKICLKCDHCRITFDTSDLDIPSRSVPISGQDDPRFKLTISKIFNRDRIHEIRCDKGLIRNTHGLEKRYHSQTALLSAREIEGTCPLYSGEEEEDVENSR